MGSRHALSNGNEPQEVTEVLSAFAQENQVSICLMLSVRLVDGGTAVELSATAENAHTDPLVRRRWASVSVSCPVSEYKTLLGLHIGLLYRLDGAIGDEEMRVIGLKRA